LNKCYYCREDVRGFCCYYSTTIDEKDVVLTNHPCKFLDLLTKECEIYPNRNIINPNCLTVKQSIDMGYMPKECKYVEDNKEYQKRKDTRRIKLPPNTSKYNKIIYNKKNNQPHNEIACYHIVRCYSCPQCKEEPTEELWSENGDYFVYICERCKVTWDTEKETKAFQEEIRLLVI